MLGLGPHPLFCSSRSMNLTMAAGLGVLVDWCLCGPGDPGKDVNGGLSKSVAAEAPGKLPISMAWCTRVHTRARVCA